MENLESALNEALKTGKGTSITLELDTGSYLESNIKTIKILQKKGLSGVYVSIQRPFKNSSSLLKKQGVNLNKITFIDVASAVSEVAPEKDDRCVHVSQKLDIDELVRAIYTSAEKMKGKRFIFIDSLTTFALHKPISETLRFSDFLMSLVKGKKDIILIFNVAKDLSQREFVRDVVMRADKTIEVKA
ncbi:MAG: hypothetical protein AABX47_01690 [Nanoarchaeota archaeon]